MMSVLHQSENMPLINEIKVYYVSDAQAEQIDCLQALILDNDLPISLCAELVQGKLNQKYKQQLSAETTNAVLVLDHKNKLSLLKQGLSVAPEWDKLQQRVVSAGRKSELLLQAVKITADSLMIDATAGFGHDSLILASSGAQVIMLEQQPVMALLLLAEQQRMSSQPNWQKLMARLTVINTDALLYFSKFDSQDVIALNNADDSNKNQLSAIYLDPMFPENSYQDNKTGKGAKVGKHMQALHQIARPPTLPEEQQLLNCAQTLVIHHAQKQGRVIVKRPQHAPWFGEQAPNESWHNDAVRFDGYFV